MTSFFPFDEIICIAHTSPTETSDRCRWYMLYKKLYRRPPSRFVAPCRFGRLTGTITYPPAPPAKSTLDKLQSLRQAVLAADGWKHSDLDFINQLIKEQEVEEALENDS